MFWYKSSFFMISLWRDHKRKTMKREYKRPKYFGPGVRVFVSVECLCVFMCDRLTTFLYLSGIKQALYAI